MLTQNTIILNSALKVPAMFTGVVHRRDSRDLEWYSKGLLHRIGAPAWLRENGDNFWYFNDKSHRTEGPSGTWSNGVEHHALLGISINKISNILIIT